jgi:hypothetical protein
VTTSEETQCESLRHDDVPARHVITVKGDQHGYQVCDTCLLSYVSGIYLRSEYLGFLPFEVSPL